MAGAGADVWKITGEDRAKHDAQFFQLKPVNGFVTGDQAKGFFMQSGLSTQVLGQIWTLADMNGDGKMDKKEFSIAMHLIKKKLQGYELPKALPPSLKADPSPVMGSFGVTPSMPLAPPPAMAMGMPPMAMGGMGGMRPMGAPTMTTGAMGMPIMANGMQQLGMQPVPPNPVPGMMAPGMGAPGMVAPAMGMPGMPATTMAGVAPPPAAGASGMAMPHASKLKYTQLFNTNDRKKCGFLTGVEARAILVTTGLPQPTLAQIWNLSDVDKDGKLTCDEFCLALHLSDLARQGKVLPATLPPDLLPSRTRSGSLNMAPAPMPAPVDAGAPKKDAFGDLLGSMGMPPPQLPTLPAANGEPKVEEFKEPESFEDKRKKNFDAGQAILDQKRAQLQEQFRMMEQERLAKEREEQEKRERARQEQERKRLMELERKMEKQRQLEMEREEQRKKQMEAREAARREVERQRQMEWEQQRKMQLLAEKHREYEQLSTLKAQFGNLKCELDSLDEKKMELNSKIQQVRNGVTDFTTSIEKMRESRDSRLGEISRLEQQIQELSMSYGRLHSDKEQLTYQVQTSVQNTPLSDTHRTVMHSVELKKTNLQRLKKELEQLESDTESNLSQIDIDNAEMERLQKQLATLQEELPRLQAKQRQRQAEKQALARKKEEEERQKERAKLEAKVKKAEAPPSSAFSNGQGTADGWDAFGSSAPSGGGEAWGGGAQPGSDAWGGTTATAGSGGDVWGSDPFANQTAMSATVPSTAGVKKKYRAVFDFEARSDDELTVTSGDMVEVFEGETMPGMENWVKGELNGRVGWIPNNYVEPLGDAAPVETPTATTTPASSTVTSAFSAFQSEATVPAVAVVEEVKPQVAPVAESAGPSVDESALPSTVSAVPVEGQLAPEGMRAQALHPWKARQDNHLTFSKDEIINVRQQKDQWWLGEINGKTGWFPKAYVKVTDAGRARSTNLSPANTLERDSQSSASVSPAPDRKDGEYFVAMYPYVADVEADLSFNEGDMILVTDQNGEWWTGTVGDKTGTFPANYVKKVDMQPDSSSEIFGTKPPAPPGREPQTRSTPSGSGGGTSAPIAAKVSNPSSPPGGDPFADLSFDPFSPSSTGGSSAKTSDLANAFASMALSSVTATPSKDAGSSGGGMAEEKPQQSGEGAGGGGSSKPGDLFSSFNNLWGSAASAAGKDAPLLGKSPALGLSSQEAPTTTTSPLDSLGTLAWDTPSQNTPAQKAERDDMIYDDCFNLESSASDGTSQELQNIFASAALSGQAAIVTASQPAISGSTSPHVTWSTMPSSVTAISDDAPALPPRSQTQVSLSEVRTSEARESPPRVDRRSRSSGEVPPPLPPGRQSLPELGSGQAPPPPPRSESLKGAAQWGVENDPGAKSSKKPEIAVVIAPYTATGPGQLTLEQSNMILVRQKSPRGWWEGELQARGQKRKIGWFPANYVKLLGSTSARSTPDPHAALSTPPTSSQLSASAAGSRSATPHSQPSQSPIPPPGTPDPNSVQRVKALYAYEKQNEDELSFAKDSLITVLSQDNPDWWQGELDGQTGVFPSNYVVALTDSSA